MLKNGPLYQILKSDIDHFLKEDGLLENITYLSSLPSTPVTCHLHFKSDMTIAGLPYFEAVFMALGSNPLEISNHEGTETLEREKKVLSFQLPFNIAISGERLALNLLAHSSRIATHTKKFTKMADEFGIAILDTRKTTPGLRSLEKYAVTVGGGSNHRMSQTDIWMIKDNHKKFFGGIAPAIEFFRSQKSFYKPIVLEIHSTEELKEGMNENINHFLLDNFTPSMIHEAVALKKSGVTFEISGGVTLQTLSHFLIKGVDAISSGAITYSAPAVDLSLKMER